jgi:WD40 repeat protein
VKIWDWQQARVVRIIDAQAEDVAFDPGGTRLATSDPDGPVEIWDVASGEKVATLAGHTSAVWSLRFSRDGSQIASASFDSTVRVWDAERGGEVVTLRGHKGGASHVALSPDGSKLASVGTDNVRVWAIDLDDLIGIARKEVTRTLTDDECRQYLHVDQCPP